MTATASQNESMTEITLDEPLTEELIEKSLVLYILPVIIIVGSAGNALSFAVLSRSRMRRTSVYFYLTVLACADTAVLFLSAFKTWIRLTVGFEFLHVSDFTCRTTMFTLVFSLHFSAWLLVLVTGDRFVAVWFPFRASVLCSARRARLAVVMLALALVLYNVHLFWTVHLKYPDSAKSTHPDWISNSTTSNLEYSRYETSSLANDIFYKLTTFSPLDWSTTTGFLESKELTSQMSRKLTINSGSPKCAGRADLKFMKEPFEYLKLATYSVLPFIIILIINVLIVVKLRWRVPPIRRHLTSGLSLHRKTAQNRESYSATVMLTSDRDDDGNFSTVRQNRSPQFNRSGLNNRPSSSAAEQSTLGRQARVTYMLLSVSISYLLLSGPFTLNLIISHPSTDRVTKARYKLLRAVCFLLMYMNHAINFFLYCLTGRKFRQELKEMFGGIVTGCHRARYANRHPLPSPSMKTLRTHIHDAELQDMTSPPDYAASRGDDIMTDDNSHAN